MCTEHYPGADLEKEVYQRRMYAVDANVDSLLFLKTGEMVVVAAIHLMLLNHAAVAAVLRVDARHSAWFPI